MITNEIFYAVKCNRCGITSDEDNAYYHDEESAIENALDNDWHETNNKHFCPECFDYDDKTDTYNILPDFPKHVKEIEKFFKRVILGILNPISECKEYFTISGSLSNSDKLEDYEEKYLKERFVDKIISIEYKKHERYTRFEYFVKVQR